MCKKIKNDNISAWKRKRKRRGFFGEERFKASSEIATSILITILLEKEWLNSWFEEKKPTKAMHKFLWFVSTCFIAEHLYYSCTTWSVNFSIRKPASSPPPTILLFHHQWPTRFSLKIGDLSARRIYNYTSSLSLKDRKHGKRTKGRKEGKISKGK